MSDIKPKHPPGTVLLGSKDMRTYLYVHQTAERMEVERETARRAGVDGMVDFVFDLDNWHVCLTYDELKARITGTSVPCRQCGGIVAPRQGGICLYCSAEQALADEAEANEFRKTLVAIAECSTCAHTRDLARMALEKRAAPSEESTP